MNCSHKKLKQLYLQVKKDGVLSSHDWHLDIDELASKFNKNTKAIIINQPNNPLGKVIQPSHVEERGGSVVECMTGDRVVAGSSLTESTALCP